MTVGSFMAFTTAAGLLYDPFEAVANLTSNASRGHCCISQDYFQF